MRRIGLVFCLFFAAAPARAQLNLPMPGFSTTPVSNAGSTLSPPAASTPTAPSYTVHQSTPGLYLFGGPGEVKASTTTAKKSLKEPLIISGAVLTPTAYRPRMWPGLGPSVDMNAAYYIGRLYGRNSLNWTTDKTNYIDRLGVWFLSIDGKMQIQHETARIPAVAAGAEGIYSFRDAPQPSVNTPGVTVKVSAPTTKTLAGAYLVASKKIFGQYWSAGYERGNAGNRVGFLSEFLTPEALTFSGHPNSKEATDTTWFGSVILFPRTSYPIKMEYMKFAGAPLNPFLVNLRIGSLLHLNFDISYLKFDGGYDVLGNFGFRYSLYPQ